MSAALPSKAITGPSLPPSALSSLRVWQLMKIKVPELGSYLDCPFCAALTRPKEWHCSHCHVTFTRSKAKFLQHQVRFWSLQMAYSVHSLSMFDAANG